MYMYTDFTKIHYIYMYMYTYSTCTLNLYVQLYMEMKFFYYYQNVFAFYREEAFFDLQLNVKGNKSCE